ncbi:Lipid A biosynthesis, N-terminal [Candidatus Gottesmanbacteria bacterium RIFCSPLOWO2_01_FULL_49_10]|uniref:Lipid A biosynthesis, N-terminal n=1 Tax=Candidatus Gottesmanbacteria bacterium RIFCSPLOWO2_01_FULL_49_10 TaxID=1798396 RepID=A0A1F6AW96_9BACT|nr:MAG: Lipid A biosynthesis, N-terminal [Candidatus Gottesmanbacteria bacterium RIFCSPLOWO2_01_FULL_49_10]
MNVILDWWVLFGFSAQFVFFLRFFVQWLQSEKQKQSVIPMSFWYLSVIGSVMILIYALKRGDPVFIAGQFLALFIYIRNIILRRESRLKRS